MPLVEYHFRHCSSITKWRIVWKSGLVWFLHQAFNFPSWKCWKKRNDESTGCDVRKEDGIYVWCGKMWCHGWVCVESVETPTRDSICISSYDVLWITNKLPQPRTNACDILRKDEDDNNNNNKRARETSSILLLRLSRDFPSASFASVVIVRNTHPP